MRENPQSHPSRLKKFKNHLMRGVQNIQIEIICFLFENIQIEIICPKYLLKKVGRGDLVGCIVSCG